MLVEKIEKTITKFNMINKGDKIIVGVSGGPDSMTLLHTLLQLKEKYEITVYVAHINHKIRENAKSDEQYVEKFCKDNQIQFFVKEENVKKSAKDEKKSIEEKGREVRYNFFEELMKKTNANKIAIAHNMNDNCETVLMNLIRGTGLAGLKGIEAKRNEYIRPLIECSRDEIEEYCKQNNINPRHDETNEDNAYTRNRIRNVLIPYLKKEFNPNIINGINRLSDIVKEEQEYLEEEVKKAYSEIILSDENAIIYDLKKFNTMDKVIQKRLILLAIQKIFGNTKGIEKINLEDIIKLCNNNIGNKFLKPNQQTKIEIRNKKIVITKE